MEITKQDYPTHQGLKTILEVVKAQYVAQETGICYARLSQCVGGKVTLTAEHVEALNVFIPRMAERIMAFRVADGDVVGQLAAAKDWLKVRPFCLEYMGVNMSWYRSRISDKTNYYYNKVTQQEVVRINEQLTMLAIRLMQMRLVNPVQETTT